MYKRQEQIKPLVGRTNEPTNNNNLLNEENQDEGSQPENAENEDDQEGVSARTWIGGSKPSYNGERPAGEVIHKH